MSKQAHEVTDTTASQTEKKRDHLFKPGAEWRGNRLGRPKGSRHKLDGLFIDALYKDFKEGGADAIVRCRKEKPDVYLKVIAHVLPKDINVKADQSLADFADGLSAVARFLSEVAAEAGGSDHEGPLPDGSLLSSGARPTAH